MTAPIYIEQLLNAYLETSSFYIVGGVAKIKNSFTLAEGGYLKWDDGEGYISSLDPFTIQTKTGNDYTSGKLTPLYPYLVRGTVMDAINKLETEASKRFPMLLIDTIGRRETKTEIGYSSYDLRILLISAYYDNDRDQWVNIYDPYLDPLADNMIRMLKRSMFKDWEKRAYEGQGDGTKYGTEIKNVFGEITNAIEITGDFIYNNKKQC